MYLTEQQVHRIQTQLLKSGTPEALELFNELDGQLIETQVLDLNRQKCYERARG